LKIYVTLSRDLKKKWSTKNAPEIAIPLRSNIDKRKKWTVDVCDKNNASFAWHDYTSKAQWQQSNFLESTNFAVNYDLFLLRIKIIKEIWKDYRASIHHSCHTKNLTYIFRENFRDAIGSSSIYSKRI